jgi:hypothetical protein
LVGVLSFDVLLCCLVFDVASFQRFVPLSDIVYSIEKTYDLTVDIEAWILRFSSSSLTEYKKFL